MTMKKLLGISLGLVMLIGSVPLGFSEPMNLTDGMAITDTVEINKHTVPKSLYKQIQSGVSQNELVCANTNHVLAERHNGNLACVSERTADRMNWQRIIFTATIDDVLEELDNIESQENDKATQETVEISDEKILLTPELEGHTSQGISKYPYFNIEVPSQVAKGEPFDVKATWSWVIYETDDNGNIIYDRDSGLPIIEDSASLDYERQRASERSIEDRKIGIFSVSGAELLDSDFTLIDFDDEVPILGYGKESTVYSLDIMYDESKVHEKNISFQIDEIIETRNAIQVGLVHGVQYILYLYEDNGVITLETEQRQDFINYMSEQYKKTDYKEKFYEDMKADYQNRGLSISDIPLKHIPKDYMDRPDKLSDELREQLKEFHEPTPEQEQRIKELHLNKTESDFPETRELIQSQNLTEVKDIIRYLGTNNYDPDFIDKFLKHFHNQTRLETQSFQNPLSYFILPNAFAQTTSEITVYGNFYLDHVNSNNKPAKNVKACIYEYDENFTAANKSKRQAFSGVDCEYTTSTGYYNFTIPYVDMDDSSSEPDIVVVFTFENDQVQILDRDVVSTGGDYPLFSTYDNELNVVGTSGYYNMGKYYPNGTDASNRDALDFTSRVFWIYQYIDDAYDAFRADFGYTTPLVRILYGSTVFQVTSFDETKNQIKLNGYTLLGDNDDADYPDIVYHEYGHKINHAAWGLDTSKDIPGNCSTHDYDITVEADCAWSEGFATFISAVVENDPVYLVSTHDKPANIETGKYDTDDNGLGGTSFPVVFGSATGYNEGWVASALWDIYDDRFESGDDLDELKSQLWTTFTDPVEADDYDPNYPASTLGFL